MSIVKDPALAEAGRKKIQWVRDFMPALSQIEARFLREKPFQGLRVAVSVHLEAKTANLGYVLQQGGAEVYLTGSNPLSTQDDVAAGLASMGVETFGIHGASPEEYQRHLTETLKCHPHLVIDDGGDLIDLLGGQCQAYADCLIGGCEETTTGILRLKAREKAGILPCPMMAVNDAKAKHYYDNKYGTGQSVWDGIMHTTNLVVAGKTVVVAGYGWCGKGVAMRAAGLGARVIVTEIDPFKALDATMNGFQVMTMDQAAPLGDVFVTVTGCRDVIVGRHFAAMKDNVLLANAGHFDCEVACRMKKMTTPASNAQSAIRSNVESKKAPNWVPPVVSAAIEPSRESASTSNVSTTAPANNHPVMPVAKATTMVPIAPITVTAFAVRPRDTSALANGSISLLNGARRCSNMRIPVLRKAKGRASVSM